MEIIDANYILRYLLKDIEDQYLRANSIIENHDVFFPGGIVAEVVYVLQKVYIVPDETIQNTLLNLFEYPTITINEPLGGTLTRSPINLRSSAKSADKPKIAQAINNNSLNSCHSWTNTSCEETKARTPPLTFLLNQLQKNPIFDIKAFDL